MNTYQMNWAAAHDWFLMVLINTPTNDGYCIVVKDDMNAGQELEFWDFEELKEWAGY